MLMGSALLRMHKKSLLRWSLATRHLKQRNEKGEIIGFDVDVANAICKGNSSNLSL